MARLVSKLFAAGLFNSLPDSYVSSKEDQDQVNQNIKDYKEKGNKLNESLKKKQDKLANSDRLTDTDIKRYEADIEVLKDKIAINDENINGSKAQLTGNNEQFRKSMDNAINYNSRLNEDLRISNNAKRDNEQEKLENKLTGRNNLGNNEDQMRKQQNQKFVDKSRKFSKAGYNDERDKIITLLLNLREAKNTRNKESILHSLENVSKNIKDNKINELILSLVTELKKISINDSQYDQIISDTIENMKSESVTRLFSDKAVKAITRFYANPPVNGNYGIADGFRQIGTGFGNMATDLGNGIANTASNIWGGIKRTATNMGNSAQRSLNNAWDGISNTASNAYNTAANSVGNAYNNAVNTVQGWGNNISNAASNAYNTAATGIGNAYDNAVNTVQGWGNNISNAASNAYNNVSNTISDMGGRLKNAYNALIPNNSGGSAGWQNTNPLLSQAANIKFQSPVASKPTIDYMNGNPYGEGAHPGYPIAPQYQEPQGGGKTITTEEELNDLFNKQFKNAGVDNNNTGKSWYEIMNSPTKESQIDDLQSRIQDAVNRNDTAEAERLSQELESMNPPSLVEEY